MAEPAAINRGAAAGTAVVRETALAAKAADRPRAGPAVKAAAGNTLREVAVEPPGRTADFSMADTGLEEVADIPEEAAAAGIMAVAGAAAVHTTT
jgi:hypothetical protein